jgi:hypothetical protein
LYQGFKWGKLLLLPSGTISDGGVKASHRISVGDVVMRAPKDSCLTFRGSALLPLLHGAQDGPAPPRGPRRRKPTPPRDPAALVAAAPDDVRLTLALLFERAIGPRSRWAPYLATLPRSVAGVPTVWPEDEAADLLRGTELAEAWAWRRRKLVRPRRRRPSYSPPPPPLPCPLLFDE